MTKQEALILQLVKEELTPELINPKYEGLVNHPLCGHCHHASQAVYRLLGGKDKGYKLQKASDELGITHYWVVNQQGSILDPTSEQYTDLGRALPYSNKKNNQASYITTKAAKTIINAIKNR